MAERTSRKCDLTQTESIALECIKQIAREGRIAYRDEIQGAIGSENMCGSTATGVINRLVRDHHIEHVLGYPLQRGLWLRIVATGETTAEPRCTIKHHSWREILERSRDSTPVLPRHRITHTMPTLMGYLDKMTREENLSFEGAQLTLMAMGMQHREEHRIDGEM